MKLKLSGMGSEWVPCAVCQSTKFRRLASVDRYSMGIGTCQCESCGLIQTNPMPTEEALANFYRDQYRMFYRKVENPSPEHVAEYGLDRRAEYSSAYLESSGLLGRSPRVLDVGCAEGSLLGAIGKRAASAELYGIEPNPLFAAYARQTTTAKVHASLAEFEATGIQVDLVTINHVLEHIRDPASYLRRLKGLLRPGGSIYVDVPDVARYGSLDDLHIAHIYHFSRASLRNLGSLAGLQGVSLETHEPYRHPLSIRAVFRSTGDAPVIVADAEAQAASSRVRRISLLAPAFRFRRTALGSALLWLPLLGIRKVRTLRRSAD